MAALWSCLWRATAYGAGLGVGLGGAYGALAAPLAGALRGLIVQEGAERLRAALLQFLYSMPFGSPVGFIAGALVFGPLMGVLLGPPNGLILFALLRVFGPRGEGRLLERRARLAWGAALATAVVGVVVALCYVLSTDPQFPSSLKPRETPSGYGARPQDLIDLAVLSVGPAVVAVLAMRWADGKVVGWYASEFGEREPSVDRHRPAGAS